jgi:predicted DNA-binding transcriptional regulator AlpA
VALETDWILLTTKSKSTAAQVPFARKAAKLKAKRRKPALSAKLAALNQAHIIKAGLAADGAQHQSDRKHAHGARAPPVRLLGKPEILQITGVTFPTVWAWMRRNQFPRCYVIGRGSNSKSVWRSDEVDQWLAGLSLRPLKGDAPSDQKIEEHA